MANQAERDMGRVNPYLYENLVSNLESQIEHWMRQVSRESDREVAKSIRAKAEGLAYSLRLLHAFEPEFRELIDWALRGVAAMKGPTTTPGREG